MIKLGARSDRCSGCRACLLTCSATVFGEQNPKLGALRIGALFPDPGKYEVFVCDQCGVCAEACPEDAITDRRGVWRIDADKCTGCMLCVEACPYGVMFQHKARSVPHKCISCGECIEYCPRDVLFDREVADA